MNCWCPGARSGSEQDPRVIPVKLKTEQRYRLSLPYVDHMGLHLHSPVIPRKPSC